VVTLEAPFAPTAAPVELQAVWLGRVPYREAWHAQRELAAARADDRVPDLVLLLEHPAVLTLGRNAAESHVRASADELASRGFELIRVERGGEVTYHGPGQLVAYPILKLERRGLMLRPLVRALEAALADTCAAFGVEAGRREGHPGCWVDPDGASPRKVGALGLRVERGVTFHGIALNVDPDLGDFDLIDACGEPDTVSTSLAREGARVGPTAVREAALAFTHALADRLGAPRPIVDLETPTPLDRLGNRTG